MVDYREILRLRSLGNNITQVANAIHSSRHTVRDVEKPADEKGIRRSLEEGLTNQRLYPEQLYNLHSRDSTLGYHYDKCRKAA